MILDIWLQNSELDGLELLGADARPSRLPVVMISGHGNIETAVNAIKRAPTTSSRSRSRPTGCCWSSSAAPIEAARLRRRTRNCASAAAVTGSIWRQSRRDPTAAPADRPGRADRQPGPDHRPARRRQGGGRARSTRQVARAQRAVRGAELRHHAPDRMEEELFGIEKRRRRSARRARSAPSSAAHGGTLLLDEVADMPLETQGKIVRVLQEQTFQRVGGDTRVRGRRARHRLDQPRSAGLIEEGPVPRGPLLPPERGAAAGAAACASGARTSRCWPSISWSARRRRGHAAARRCRRRCHGGAAGL